MWVWETDAHDECYQTHIPHILLILICHNTVQHNMFGLLKRYPRRSVVLAYPADSFSSNIGAMIKVSSMAHLSMYYFIYLLYITRTRCNLVSSEPSTTKYDSRGTNISAWCQPRPPRKHTRILVSGFVYRSLFKTYLAIK